MKHKCEIGGNASLALRGWTPLVACMIIWLNILTVHFGREETVIILRLWTQSQ